MDAKALLSWTATISQFGMLLSGAQICLRIQRQGSTGDVAVLPFLATCASSILWTKYGLLTKDFPITVISAAGIIFQSLYLLIFYLNSRDKKTLNPKLFWSFCLVCGVLSYIKYHVMDKETAVFHLGLVCSVFSVAVYGSPLVSLATVIRKKSTECLTFSLCLANFLVSLQWAMYGKLAQDNFITVPNSVGALLGSLQLSLFVCYPSTPQRTVTYTPGSKPSSWEV
ncbi:predicted protein [Nematostella vectensis]|uniref:Sugar transporter SWEET n=1 Tax=Nematostella vectensis TaxID=45351 RepID=A7SFC4_NEMVE|nr:sugar transporter SWEET1 [Nematostella vectensis]EDO37599.1 predicted protein [Nematostella vectensis]|eukprot:XP_001629662.1 predicted protein [Nematostella vectensis]